jgi:hypothetical protein
VTSISNDAGGIAGSALAPDDGSAALVASADADAGSAVGC